MLGGGGVFKEPVALPQNTPAQVSASLGDRSFITFRARVIPLSTQTCP